MKSLEHTIERTLSVDIDLYFGLFQDTAPWNDHLYTRLIEAAVRSLTAKTGVSTGVPVYMVPLSVAW